VIKQESCQAGAENTEARSAEMLSVGGSFHTVAPETGKARSPKPKLERRQRGATGWRRDTERKLERAVIADVWVKVDGTAAMSLAASDIYQ
jgi:hypothetical protein